jgi:predicted secreted protein
MTWANTGFSDTFPHLWRVSFLKAVFILLPFAFRLMAQTDKGLSRLIPATPLLKRNILLGLIMSVVMQSLMVLVTTGTKVGFADLDVIRTLWQNAFIKAYPVGLALALTATVRPWLLAMLRA